jgi:hypothetical protein
LIERERAVATDGEHADESFARETDQIGVLGVKFVDEPLRLRSVMLGNFLGERFIVEPVDLLELQIFRGGLEDQRLP